MRFRPEQHLRRPGDIQAVRQLGRRVDCRAFMLLWKEREAGSGTQPRVCVVASHHAVGSAVHRSRAKRRLRELFRQHQDRVPAGCDLVLIARASLAREPMPELARRFAAGCAEITRARPASS